MTFTKVELYGTDIILPEHRARREPWHEGTRMLAMKHAMRDDPGLIIDVGAEEGDFAVLFTKWGCPVFMIEPNPLCWPWIYEIVDLNDVPGEMIVGLFEGFCGSHPNPNIDTDTEFRGWPASAHDQPVVYHGQAHAWLNEDTPTVSLDQLIGDLAPKYITIDTEGNELVVLRGASEILKRHRPIVWVSIHAEFSRQLYGITDGELHAFMNDIGYVGMYLGTDHEAHWEFRPWEKK